MQTPVAVVTGAYGGLGSELCKLIAARRISLVLVDRNLQKSKEFAVELNRLHPGIVQDVFAVDLADHSDVKRLSFELTDKYPRIDFLFNNAGVLTETLQMSPQHNELHFEVNALAPLALIDYLRPALKNAAGAVVISTSAGLSLRAKQLDWDDLLKPKEFKKLYGPYVNSKQALNVITAALAPELSGDKITIRTVDPGPNKTRLTKGKGTPLWMRLFYALLPSPDKGAKKILDGGLSSQWGTKTGIFISEGKIQPLPPALADARFQAEFLRKCRARAALVPDKSP